MGRGRVEGTTKGVLGDHKRFGKRFVPPLAMLGTLREISWIDEIVPELLWLDLLSEHHGLRRAVALAESLVDSVPSPSDGSFRLLAKLGTYATLSDRDWKALHETLPGHDLDALRTALKPLVALYPQCPFRYLWGGHIPAFAAGDIDVIRNTVAAVSSRRGRRATLIQGTAFYLSGITGQLQFVNGVEPPDLEALLDYPDTEESRRAASFIRAHMNGGLHPPGEETISAWARYFWQRGIELGPCEFEID